MKKSSEKAEKPAKTTKGEETAPPPVKSHHKRNVEPSKEIWLEVCDRITQGESLRQVLESDVVRLPTIQTFFRWADASTDAEEGHVLFGLSEQYARAILTRASIQGDEVIEIADNPWTPDWTVRIGEALKAGENKLVAVYMRAMLHHAQMRVDARKWHSARMDPKRWHLNSDSGKAVDPKDEETVNIIGGLPDGG